MQPLHCSAGVAEPALGAAAGLGRWVVGVAVLWRFPEEEAALGNHSAQSPAYASVASPEHTMGCCKVKHSLYSVQHVWLGLRWGLRQGWAGGLWGEHF